MSFDDPLIRAVIKKYVPQALVSKNDLQLENYLGMVTRALPKGEDTLEGADLTLFCDLVGMLQPHKASSPLIKLFFRNLQVKSNMIMAIPFQSLQYESKTKLKSKSNQSEDARPTQVVPAYEFSKGQIRYFTE